MLFEKNNELKEIKVKKGQILQYKGDINTSVYNLKSGLLRSYSIDDNGKEHIYMFAPLNWIIADNCETSIPCNLFIDALEDSVLLISEKEVEIRNANVKSLVNRLGALQDRILGLMSPQLWYYKIFLEIYPAITQRVPQRMIASYLGITPEALSRVRK